MKKKLLLFAAFMLIGVEGVSAKTILTQSDFDAAVSNLGVETKKITCNDKKCTLAANEEYVLSGDITLADSRKIFVTNDTVLTLNNATVNSSVTIQSNTHSTSTINGTGTLKKVVDVFNGGITISGNVVFDKKLTINPVQYDDPSAIENGTFNDEVQINYADFIIKSGNFNQELIVDHGASGEIKGGTFKCEKPDITRAVIRVLNTSVLVIADGKFEYLADDEDAVALLAEDYAEVTINGGTFKSLSTGAISIHDNVILEIRGGTFTGVDIAGYFKEGTTELFGGTFKATGTGVSTGAIATDGTFEDLLANGYMYVGKTDYTVSSNGGVKFLNAREISVTHKPYDFLEGQNQLYNPENNRELSFRIDAEYDLFKNGGKVFVDNIETKEFISKSGSTIITLKDSLLNTLASGNHTLKVVFKNGGVATTTFKVAAATNNVVQTPTTTNETTTTNNETIESLNPKTGDNIIGYVTLLGLSLIGLVGFAIYLKKRMFN